MKEDRSFLTLFTANTVFRCCFVTILCYNSDILLLPRAYSCWHQDPPLVYSLGFGYTHITCSPLQYHIKYFTTLKIPHVLPTHPSLPQLLRATDLFTISIVFPNVMYSASYVLQLSRVSHGVTAHFLLSPNNFLLPILPSSLFRYKERDIALPSVTRLLLAKQC